MTVRKLAQMPAQAHIVQMKRLRILLLSTGALLAVSGFAQFVPQSGAQLTVLPFVQPNGVVDLNLSANWLMSGLISSISIGWLSGELQIKRPSRPQNQRLALRILCLKGG